MGNNNQKDDQNHVIFEKKRETNVLTNQKLSTLTWKENSKTFFSSNEKHNDKTSRTCFDWGFRKHNSKRSVKIDWKSEKPLEHPRQKWIDRFDCDLNVLEINNGEGVSTDWKRRSGCGERFEWPISSRKERRLLYHRIRTLRSIDVSRVSFKIETIFSRVGGSRLMNVEGDNKPTLRKPFYRGIAPAPYWNILLHFWDRNQYALFTTHGPKVLWNTRCQLDDLTSTSASRRE